MSSAEDLPIELQADRPVDIQSVSAISPDRSLIATGTENDISLAKAADGRFIRSFPVSAEPQRLVFSPDGRKILSVSLGEGVLVYDLLSGKLESRMQILSGLSDELRNNYPLMPFDMAISPDGRFVVVVGKVLATKITTPGVILDLQTGNVVTRLEAVDKSGRPLLALDKGSEDNSRSYFTLSSVSFNASGTAVIAGSPRGAVRTWSATTGRLNTVSLALGEYINKIIAIDKQNAIVSTGDKTVHVVDVAKLKSLHLYELAPKTPATEYTFDGKKRPVLDFAGSSKSFIWANSNGAVAIARLGNKGPAANFTLSDWKRNDTVVNAFFSAQEGELIITSGFGRLLTADLSGRTASRRPDKPSPGFRSTRAALGLGGYEDTTSKLLMAGSPGIFELDHNSGELVSLVKGPLAETGPISRAPNGDILAADGLYSGTGGIKIFSASGTKRVVVPELTSSPSGDIEWIASRDNENFYYIRVYYSPSIFQTFRELRTINRISNTDKLVYKFGDPTDEEPFPYALDASTGNFYIAHFDRDPASKDGRRLSQKIIANGQEVFINSLREDFPNYVGFIDKGQRIAIATLSSPEKPGMSLRVYSAKTGEPAGEVSIPENSIKGAYFSDSNGDVAVIGENSQSVHVIDANRSQIEVSFAGCGVALNSIQLSNDSRFIAAAGKGVICIFDRKQKSLLARSTVFEDGSWVTVTPEGFFTGSPEGMKNLSVIRGLDIYSIGQVKQELYRPDLVREKLAGDPAGKVTATATKLDLGKILDSGRAPLAKVTSPVEATAVGKAASVEVEAAIEDRGGGVGKIEWRVNDITLGVEARGVNRDDVSGGALSRPVSPGETVVTVKRLLALQPGENRIEVVAYNGRNLIASDPAVVYVRRDADAHAEVAKPRLHVLAVGVNDYWDSRLKLNYSVADASALAEAFRIAGQKLYGEVNVRTVFDADVTSGNLDRVFAEMGQSIAPQDVFVFYLAGHGKTIDGRYYFVPYDFRYRDARSFETAGVDQDRFQRWFAQIPANKSIMLYDTCESGTLTGFRVASRGVAELEAMQKLIWATGRSVLTASTETTDALEGYNGHGVFTYALLDGFGRADSNQDGVIEITELAQFVDRTVPEISQRAFGARQVPQMQIVGSGFALASTTMVLEGAPDSMPPTAVASKIPTDVVITLAPLFATLGEATPTGTLQPGTRVSIVEIKDGWSLVAKDGKNLGYVDSKSLLKLQ